MIYALLFLAALPPRVQQAKDEKDASLRAAFVAQGLEYPPREIYLRAFKREKSLELWVKKGTSYVLFKRYPICASSGELGPKRQSGDGQVPEGFYEISGFNPASNYFLSLRVNYPNASDKALSKASSLGGDIMVHGNCVTIGCIPLTDDLIKEVYWIASQARGPIPIHIFPAKLDDLSALPADPELQAFWKMLQPGYAMFEKTHIPPRPKIDKSGRYVF